MDAHLFRRFCEDLLPALIGSRIEKIYQAADGVITFSLYGLANVQQKNSASAKDTLKTNVFADRKHYLTYKEGKEAFLFLSHSRITKNDEPPAFVMRLRKHLAGKHIKTAAANWLERKIILEVSDCWVSLDLRHGIELHFGCPENALCSPAGGYFDFEASYTLSPALSDGNLDRKSVV